MRQQIKESGLSREQIVDSMNRLAKEDGVAGGRGNKISLANLDAWCAESKPNVISLNLLPYFNAATDSLLTIDVQLAPHRSAH